MHILVMAKSPVAGTVKTRLCPPCSPTEAAAIAQAALADTLDAVGACQADRRVLALDGPVGDWLPEGFEVVPQRGDSFAARLAAAWEDVGGPGLQIAMDTPQLTATLLDAALDQLSTGVPAVLGRTSDGGWWGIGFQQPAAGVFDGVPMSAADTAERQLARCAELGIQVEDLPPLRDVDTWDDAVAVAGDAPATRFAAAVRSVAEVVGGRHH